MTNGLPSKKPKKKKPATPKWKSMLSKFKGAKRKTVRGVSSKGVYFKTTLAVVGVVSGAFAFIGALVIKDFLKDGLTNVTNRFKNPWIKVAVYSVVGIVVAIAGTIMVEVIRSNINREKAQYEADEAYKQERRDMCTKMLRDMKKEKELGTLEEYLKGAKGCHNYRDMSKHVTSIKNKRKACDKAMDTLKTLTDPDAMMKLMEENADCYNKEAMKTYFDAEQQKRKTCDELLVKIKESTSLDDKQKLFEGNGEVLQQGRDQQALLKSFQDKRRCDKALKTLKATADTDTMLKLMEKHADCYNKEAMKTYFDAEQQKRKTCDEMLVKIKEQSATQKVETVREQLYKGNEECYNKADVEKFLRTAAADQAVCDRALESAKAVSANKDALAEVLEKHAGCYNIGDHEDRLHRPGGGQEVRKNTYVFRSSFFLMHDEQHVHGLGRSRRDPTTQEARTKKKDYEEEIPVACLSDLH